MAALARTLSLGRAVSYSQRDFPEWPIASMAAAFAASSNTKSDLAPER